MLKIIIRNQHAYETHFPKVKVIYAEKQYWVIKDTVNEKDYLQNYITKQPTVECVEAWFEGAVKGVCKPKLMM